MRELIESLYLFSLAQNDFAKIIAHRSGKGERAVGKNIFEHLGIKRSEMKYLDGARYKRFEMPVAVVSERDGVERIVLFDLSSSVELPLGLAMEFDRATASLALEYKYGLIEFSPSARKIVDKCEHEKYHVVSEVSASRSVEHLCTLRDLLVVGRNTEIFMSKILSAVSELVCLPIEFSFSREMFSIDDGNELLFVNTSLFIALAVAMLAREDSDDRRLFADVIVRREFALISLSFLCSERKVENEENLRFLLAESGLMHEVRVKDGRFYCVIAPCYADEGVSGVKDQMDIWNLLDFYK